MSSIDSFSFGKALGWASCCRRPTRRTWCCSWARAPRSALRTYPAPAMWWLLGREQTTGYGTRRPSGQATEMFL
jgi:hypothetical protein